MVRFGVHMPLKGGFEKSISRAKEIGCRAIQIFPGNPAGWKMGKPDEAEIKSRAQLVNKEDLQPLVVHCAYLVNLATNNEDFLVKSKRLLNETMERAALYGAPYVVLHTGNHGGGGREKGLKQIIAGIGEGLPGWPDTVQLLLENTAGSGTALGADYADLGQVIKAFPAGKLGVCIDTAHSWAAGYDFGSAGGVKQSLEELDRAVGLEHLKVIHANDTRVALGSRVDRHAHLGGGSIALEGFAALVNYGWPEDFPLILETPDNGTEWDRINLDKLASLVES